jgi:hypothetical protein
VQCTAAQAAASKSGSGTELADAAKSVKDWWVSGPTFADCIPHEDTDTGGKKFAVSFACYAGPVEGAADVVRHVIKNRPRTAQALGADRTTVFRASYAMRRESYYGGFCPNAIKQYGAEAGRASFKTPDKSEGTKACAEEAITLHAKRLHSLMRQIACTMGEKTIPLGTYADAAAWYGKA